ASHEDTVAARADELEVSPMRTPLGSQRGVPGHKRMETASREAAIRARGGRAGRRTRSAFGAHGRAANGCRQNDEGEAWAQEAPPPTRGSMKDGLLEGLGQSERVGSL